MMNIWILYFNTIELLPIAPKKVGGSVLIIFSYISGCGVDVQRQKKKTNVFRNIDETVFEPGVKYRITAS